ncbi:molting protein mlt-4 [Anaeramoeba ignava]|uniref:Molting protein mlt-4 n=1 Tax=Anaeramoeba ignava TaxID=1746090 RepID=A0A9Q0LW48_ANAIG|nr:molting protein mlt-4 [Anaeramoeba ignava]
MSSDYLETVFQLCRAGKIDVLKQMLEKKDNQLWKGKNQLNQNALFVAIEHNRIEVVKLLLNNGIETELKSKATGFYPIHLVIEKNQPEILKLLLESGADPNSESAHKFAPIHFSVKLGRIECFKYLIANEKVDLYSIDLQRNNILHLCALTNRTEEASMIIEKTEFKLNTKNNDGMMPIHIAAQKSHFDILEVFSQKSFSFEDLSSDEQSVLHYAAESGNIKSVELVLQHKVAIDSPNSAGLTPLQIAQIYGHEEVVRLLSSKGARSVVHDYTKTNNFTALKNYIAKFPSSVNAIDYSCRQPIHWAAMNGFDEITELLINSGSQIDKEDRENFTPLLLAIRNDNKNTMRMLIQHGASLEKCDTEKNTAIHLALIYGHLETADYLTEKGANLDTKNIKGYTPFHLACLSGSEGLFEKMLDQGANLTILTNQQQTILHLSCKKSRVGIAKKIVTMSKLMDLRIDEPDIKNQTPFLLAVKKNNMEIVEFLFKMGININIENKKGFRPIHYAIMNSNASLVKMLLENQADISNEVDGKNIVEFVVEKSRSAEMMILFMGSENPQVQKYLNEKDSMGNLAIHRVAITRKTEMLAALASDPRFVNAQNNEGNTAAHIVAMDNIKETAQALAKTEMDLAIRNKENLTPFEIACQKGSRDFVQILLDNYEKVLDLTGNSGKMGILFAGKNGHLEIAEMLVSRGVECPLVEFLQANQIDAAKDLLEQGFLADIIGICGENALHLGIKNKMNSLLPEILQRVRDVNKKNATGKNAIQIAAEEGNLEACNLLLDYGVDLVNYSKAPDFPHLLAENNKHSECAGMLTAEFKRTYAVFEIVQTERNYVNIIGLLVTRFAKSAVDKKVLSKTEAKTVFMNISDIWKSHTSFLENLEQRTKHWNRHEKIGDIITKHSESLYQYRDYNTNFENSRAKIKELESTNQAFVKHLKDLGKDPELRKLDLNTILIKPVQRLGQYPLLLKEVVKRTPQNHPDYPLVTEALRIYTTSANDINEQKRMEEQLIQLGELEKQISGLPLALSKSKQRVLLHRGKINYLEIVDIEPEELMKKNRERTRSFATPKSMTLKPNRSMHRKQTKKKSKKPKSRNTNDFLLMEPTVNPFHFPAIRSMKKINRQNFDFHLDADAQNELEWLNTPIPKKRETHGYNVGQRYLFLFNDLLLICKQKKTDNYELEHCFPIVSIFVSKYVLGLPDPEFKSFQITTPTGTYAFVTESTLDCSSLREQLKSAISRSIQFYFDFIDDKVEQTRVDMGNKSVDWRSPFHQRTMSSVKKVNLNTSYSFLNTTPFVSKSEEPDQGMSPLDFLTGKSPKTISKKSSYPLIKKELYIPKDSPKPTKLQLSHVQSEISPVQNRMIPKNEKKKSSLSLYSSICYYLQNSNGKLRVKSSKFICLAQSPQHLEKKIYERIELKDGFIPSLKNIRILSTQLTEGNENFLFENEFYK